MSELPQHLQALAKADRIRSQRSALVRQIKSGEKTVAEVLREMPECIESMRVIDLLAAPRYRSKNRARAWLADAAMHGLFYISEYRRCRELTERERKTLIERLENQEGGGVQ